MTMAETGYAPSVADDLSCDIKLVDMADKACNGMLELGYSRRDIEALGYFMELLGERLRKRYEAACGSPYDYPVSQPDQPRPSARLHLVEPFTAS